MATTADIERYGQMIAAAANAPVRVFVFGSHARDEARPDSDIDFLVLEQTVENRAEETVRLRRALPKLAVPVDLIVLSEDQAAERAQVSGSTVARALAECRLVAAA